MALTHTPRISGKQIKTANDHENIHISTLKVKIALSYGNNTSQLQTTVSYETTVSCVKDNMFT